MSVNNIYRSDEFFRQAAEQKLWTAWRTEKRLNKTTGELKETKVPYCGIGIKSESDDPATWINIEDAAQIAGTEGFINGDGGGIGIFLGIDCGNGYRPRRHRSGFLFVPGWHHFVVGERDPVPLRFLRRGVSITAGRQNLLLVSGR